MRRLPRKIKKYVKNCISCDIIDRKYNVFGIQFEMPSKKNKIIYGQKIWHVYCTDDLWFKFHNK